MKSTQHKTFDMGLVGYTYDKKRYTKLFTRTLPRIS